MKAQSAVEFLIIMCIFLVALGIVIVSLWINVENINSARVDSESLYFLNKISGKINTVFLEDDGFSVNITLPEIISNFDYTFNIYNGTLILELNNKTYHGDLLTKNITGNLKKGWNLLENINGEVVIT